MEMKIRSIDFQDQLWAKIKAEAARNCISAGALIRQVLAQYLRHQEQIDSLATPGRRKK